MIVLIAYHKQVGCNGQRRETLKELVKIKNKLCLRPEKRFIIIMVL